jgi:hypothetical protein
MSSITCKCGKSFTAQLIDGAPRTRCPYCQRPLHTGDDVIPHPLDRPDAERDAASSGESSSTFSRLLSKKTELRTALPRAPSEDSSPAEGIDKLQESESQPALAAGSALRFGNPAVTQAALRDVDRLLDPQWSGGQVKLTCPQGLACEPSQCANAFVCGALPAEGRGTSYIFWATALWVIAAVVLEIVLAAVLFLTVTPKPGRAQPDYLLGTLLLIGIPSAIGLIAFCYAYVTTFWQQQHVRALAGASQKLGLRFLGLLRVPGETAVHAFPVICPGTRSNTTPGAGEVNVRMAMTGSIDGHTVHVACYEFLAGRLEHLPLGGAVKAIAGLLKPAWLIPGNSPQDLHGYLLAMFPEPLLHVPDFLLVPWPRFEAIFLGRNFPQLVTPLPPPLRDSCLVMADGPPAVWWLKGQVVELLARLPGWSIQVVGGRLMVWHDSYQPMFGYSLLRSAEQVAELVQVAREVRQTLRRRSLT